jgi:capsular exopolysaccharide synthesis family protein
MVTAKADAEEVSFRQALRIVRKRYRTILLVALAVGLLVLFVSLMLRPYYSSTATIELQRDSSNPLNASGLGSLAESIGGSDDVKTQLTTAENVLQNSKLIDEIIEQQHFRDRYPVKASWHSSRVLKERLAREAHLPLIDAPITRQVLEASLLKSLTIDNIPDTRLLTVTFEDPDPRYAAVISNALIAQYVRDRLDLRDSDAIDASQWMSAQLEKLSQEVDSAQRRLLDYEKQSGLIAVPSTDPTQPAAAQVQDIRVQRLVAIDQQYVQVQANRVIKEAIYRICQTHNPDLIANMAGSSVIGSNDSSQGAMFAGLLALRQQQSSLKVQMASVADKYGPRNPHMLSYDSQVDALHHEIDEEIGRIVKQVKSDYEVSVAAEKNMKVALDSAMKDASAANDSQIRLAVLEQEAGSSRMLYQDLYTKLKEAQLTAGTQASNVDIISPALPTPSPVHPKVPLYTAIGFGGGVFLGVFVAFVREHLDDSVVTSVQVEEITGQPVLGYIPDFAVTKKDHSHEVAITPFRNWLALAPASPVAEAYRALRTSLLLSHAGAPPRTILVSSCLASEGKSTTAYNLAVSLAMTGKRVIAIDADMRKPVLHRFAQLSNVKGLSTVLTASTDLSDAVQGSSVDGLFILPSGPTPPNPSELVGSQAFVDLLAHLSQTFDFVVIDSPPSMLVTDPLIIAPKVDGVVLVVRSGSTTKVVLQRVTENMLRSRSNLLGFVLNAVNTQSVDYYYANGYYYDKGYYGDNKDKEA